MLVYTLYSFDGGAALLSWLFRFFSLPFPRLNLKSYILPKTHEVITGNHYCLRWDTSAVIRDSTYVKGANVHEGSN